MTSPLDSPAGGERVGLTPVERPFGKLPAASRRQGAAFTLVELLVVIMIAMLLMGILAPTLARVRVNMRVQASLATVATLETACQLYRDDHGIFPPSGPPPGQGGQLLVKALTGYEDESLDGQDGFGFRTTRRGRVYGPYNDTEKLQTVGSTATDDLRFADEFDRPFLYYRFDKLTGGYNSRDNAEGPTDINEYAKQPNGWYYRSDFLIMSSGPDAEFLAPIVDGKPTRTDDITNFLEQ